MTFKGLIVLATGCSSVASVSYQVREYKVWTLPETGSRRSPTDWMTPILRSDAIRLWILVPPPIFCDRSRSCWISPVVIGPSIVIVSTMRRSRFDVFPAIDLAAASDVAGSDGRKRVAVEANRLLICSTSRSSFIACSLSWLGERLESFELDLHDRLDVCCVSGLPSPTAELNEVVPILAVDPSEPDLAGSILDDEER